MFLLFTALDEKSLRLYVNGKEVASGITSYYIHSDFLMVTTVKHTLKCIPIQHLTKYLSESMWSSESVRALERGSKLVLAVPNDTKTVLQMPRGNLEVIHPRPLALHILKKLLDECKYKNAYIKHFDHHTDNVTFVRCCITLLQLTIIKNRWSHYSKHLSRLV